MKMCNKCKTEKELTEFDKQTHGKYGVRGQCKLCKRQTRKLYRKNNGDKLRQHERQYYQINHDKILQSKKKYDKNNKSKLRQYYQDNKIVIAQKAKQAYRRDKTKKLAYNKQYRQNNKDKYNQYIRHRLKTDKKFRLRKYLSSRVYNALKRRKKAEFVSKCLGCSIEECLLYLEKQFKLGMTWDNWGKFGWHIDHIKPLNSFDLSDREQLLKACHYTNLQPLWWYENLSKGDK
jgi:hypothetical protein